MAFFQKFMKGKAVEATPSACDDDEIYPVHMLDNTPTLKNIVVTWTLRFDDVLDADKLHDSLSRLLEIGAWRKVGGRLRLKVYHIHVSINIYTTNRAAERKSRNSRPQEIHRRTTSRVVQQAVLRSSHRRPPASNEPPNAHRTRIISPQSTRLPNLVCTPRRPILLTRLSCRRRPTPLTANHHLHQRHAHRSLMVPYAHGRHGPAGSPPCLVPCARWA